MSLPATAFTHSFARRRWRPPVISRFPPLEDGKGAEWYEDQGGPDRPDHGRPGFSQSGGEGGGSDCSADGDADIEHR